MAINFSASFAACLAAGLKVPRQIMYCISQDTGAPYVLYKDSQDADRGGAAMGANGITAGTGQWTPDMYSTALQQQHAAAQQQLSPQQHHQTTTASNVHHQQQQAVPGGGPQSPTTTGHGGTGGGGAEENGSNDPPPPHGDPHGALSSPATSPYSQTNAQDLDDDVTMSQVDTE